MNLSNQEVTLNNGVGTGLKFHGDGSNPDFARGTYELPLQKALASCLNHDHIFYDIGANIGFFTIIAAKLVGPSGHVYAFEPVPNNADIILRNVELNSFSNVTVFPQAVSESTGIGELLLAHHSGGATLATAGTPPDLRGEMTVDLVSIDDLVSQKTLKPPTVVKIDVEGAEINVLRGMIQTIKDYQPILIYEVDDGNQDSFKLKNQTIEMFIDSLGYKIMPLEPAYPNIPWYVGHAIAFSKLN